MRQLDMQASLSTFLDELEFTEAALRADPDTAELVGPFEEAIAGWSSIFSRQRAVRREVVRAEAVVAVRDAQLDQTTRRFADAVLAEAGQDRRSTFFRRFFPIAPSEFLRQGLRAQCERTRDVILPELEKLDAQSRLRPFAAPLAADVASALESLAARSRVKGEAAIARVDVEEWKEGVNQLRRSTYAELMKRAADRKLSRSWPKTFFRAVSESEEPLAPPAA